MNDVPFVIEVDRLERLAGCFSIDVQEVAMIAVEGCRALTSFNAGCVSCENVISQLRSESIGPDDVAP